MRRRVISAPHRRERAVASSTHAPKASSISLLISASSGALRAGAWKDLSTRIEGPSVTQLQAVFYEDWHFETGESLDLAGLFPDPRTPDRVAIQPPRVENSKLCG